MGTTDVTGRPVRLRETDLERFFDPDTVAVIGATDNEDSPSFMSWRQLRGWAEGRDVTLYPVNPKRDTVDGITAYPSIRDVPTPVDVAIFLIGRPEAVVDDVVAAKARFAVIFGAGFAESGSEGAQRQATIVQALADGDVRLLGPNTTLNAFQDFHPNVGGGKRIGLITQSGHQGRPLYQAQELGVGLAGWAPTGNEADLESADFIRYFADRDDVGAVAAYIEGFKDGRTLQLAADHAARRGVPLVVIKVGRTAVGQSWAQSHSGHLAGSDRIMSAVFRQYGIHRVDALDELLDTSMLLARAAPPRGDGVCIYSISGGTGAHMADLATSYGLRLPELSAATQAQLHEWIPGFLRVSNPIDSGGHATADERGPKILATLLADDDVDLLIIPIPGSFSPISEKFAQDIVDASQTTDTPICVVWGSPVATEEAYRDILVPSGLPVFRDAGNCLGAVKAYFDHHRFTSRYTSAFASVATAPSPAAAPARRLLRAGQPLSEHASKQVLRAYGIPVSRDVLCTEVEQAVAAADALGGPAVLKVSSSALLHKSDLGLVAVGVDGEAAVRGQYETLMARAREAAPDGPIDGVLVSELVEGGVETIVGLVDDALFGPTVMVGIGGISVEVYGDVSFRVPPFDAREARRMLEELDGFPLLTGVRGRPPADLDALVDVIMRVQRLGTDLAGDVAELDINPLRVGPDGAVALDALVVCR